MNGRQAAKLAAKRIEELEHVNALQVRDIKDYNACIQDFIKGVPVCEWCEELAECQLESKGHGCAQWWLRYPKGGPSDAGEGISGESSDS